VREAALAALAELGAAEAVAAGLGDSLPRIRGRTISLLADLQAADTLYHCRLEPLVQRLHHICITGG